jgi:hypothetical protein
MLGRAEALCQEADLMDTPNMMVGLYIRDLFLRRTMRAAARSQR